MVTIKQRKTPEVVICDMIAPNWRDVFKNYPMGAFAKTDQCLDASYLLAMASQCKRSMYSQVPMPDKVFMYILCFTLWRVFGTSLLSDTEYASLARHLWSGVTKDKIDTGSVVPLAYRMAFAFDVPQLGAKYRKARSMPLTMVQPGWWNPDGQPPKPVTVPKKPKLKRPVIKK